MVHNSFFAPSKPNGSTERYVLLSEQSGRRNIHGNFEPPIHDSNRIFSMSFSAVLLKVWMLSRRLKQLDPNLDVLLDQSRSPTVVNSNLTNPNARNRFQLMGNLTMS